MWIRDRFHCFHPAGTPDRITSAQSSSQQIVKAGLAIGRGSRSDLPDRSDQHHYWRLLGRGGAVRELQLITNVELIQAAEDEGELSWQERALCAQTDPEAFFPEKGGSTREAKKVCVGCDVRGECLEYALAHDERFGIWGGLSERVLQALTAHAV